MVFISQQLIHADSDSVKELKHHASHITYACMTKGLQIFLLGTFKTLINNHNKIYQVNNCNNDLTTKYLLRLLGLHF